MYWPAIGWPPGAVISGAVPGVVRTPVGPSLPEQAASAASAASARGVTLRMNVLSSS